MTDPMQAATAAWYAVKNDTRSPSPTADPTPYIAAIVRAILAAKDADARDAARYRWLRGQAALTRTVGSPFIARCYAGGISAWAGMEVDEIVDAAIDEALAGDATAPATDR